MTPFDKDVTFEVVVGNYEGASFAPIGAVSFLWNAVEQKDLADSEESVSTSYYFPLQKKYVGFSWTILVLALNSKSLA